METKKVVLPFIPQVRHSTKSTILPTRNIEKHRRVNSYLSVYGRTFDNTTDSRRSRVGNYCPVLGSKGESHISIRPNSVLRKVPPIEEDDTLKLPIQSTALRDRKIDELVYEIQKGKSDLLELRRDLATYDYNFLTERNLTPKLNQIQSAYHNLPTYSNHFAPSISQDKVMHNSVSSALDSVFSAQNIIEPPINSSKSLEDYNIRKVALSKETQIIKKGVIKVQGEYYIICIKSKGNQFHTTVSILSSKNKLITLKL